MANEKYFLQMSECKWPDHIFISRKKTFKICIYHKDSKKQHPSLYCVTNDKEAYPISIELLNIKNKVIRESNTQNNGHSRYKKLWTIISASTDFKIKHSYCEFSIQFDSLPPYYDQPLRFRFRATSNNLKIPMIEPFTTRPFRVVRYQLRISSGPPSTFYKDDGGMRNNHMTVCVELLNPNNKESKHKMSVPLKCKLMTEDGKEITGTMKHKHSIHTKQKQKSRPPLHYLQLHEDCISPKISSVSGECIVKFRINDVSQNHKNQGFHVIIQPNINKLPHLCEIYECRSSKIIVKSKSPEKLNSAGSNKKRNNKIKHKKRKKSKSKKVDTNNNENIMDHDKIKMESDLNIGNHFRKRRKLNSKQYIKTNGTDTTKPIKPKTFNVPPKHHWFPSISIHGSCHPIIDKENCKQIQSKNDINDDINDIMNAPESEIQIFAQNCFEMLQFREWICIGYQTQYIDDDKNDKLQIVRCLLCDAEGVWTHSKPPRHKKGCDFVKLKRSYHQMQSGLKESYPMPFSGNNRMSNLPPLPQPHNGAHHSRFIPPAFPPPFFGPIPPMFPSHPMPPYHILNPPPLIKDAKGLKNKLNKDISDIDKTKIKTKIKTQQSDEKQNDENRKSSPLMFPFGHQSPQIFPMQSPLFSMNNVPQTPQMFSQPLSATAPNNSFTLPQSMIHSLPSFGQTASTLPMPLQLPMNSIISPNKDKDNKDKDKNNKETSICNTSAATMGSPTATIRSNPPQSKSEPTNTNTPNTNTTTNQIAVSVDSAISRLSQSASLSAVATAGGLTISTPFAETASLSINTNHNHNDELDNKTDDNNSNNDDNNKDNKDTSQIIAAHAPPLLPRYIISPHHILHQNSSNNSIETQIGSMPPLHPDTNTCCSNKSQSSTSPPTAPSDKPLHQRRLMENAPTTLRIPNVTPFPN